MYTDNHCTWMNKVTSIASYQYWSVPVLITPPLAMAITKHWLAILFGRIVQMAVMECGEINKTVRLITDGDPAMKQKYATTYVNICTNIIHTLHTYVHIINMHHVP